MDAQQKQQRKQRKLEHRDRMVAIGVDAVLHALRFSTNSVIQEQIEARLDAIMRGRANDFYQSIKPETEYTADTCLRRASSELLKLAVSEKWVSGMMLTANVFTPCWDAGSFVSLAESNDESRWQDKTLYPVIEKEFIQLMDEDQQRKREYHRARVS
jgi:hypothetical protein